jgi:hypothetical protein
VPLAFIALPAAGLILLGYGVRQRRAASAFLRGASRAPGVVIDHVHAAGDPGSAGILCPVVRYWLPDGSEHVFTAPDGQMPPRHRVGQHVVVYYDPTQPQRALLPTATTLPTVLAAIGATLLVLGGLIGAITWWVFSVVRGS